MIQKQKKLVAKSPIAAVSWASDQPDLEIRVFTVLASNKEVIAQFSHSNNWWSVPGPSGPYMESSAIACCRNTAPETADSNPICVFYQPEPGRIVLAVFPADDSQISKDMAEGIRHPYGIPQSRGVTERTHRCEREIDSLKQASGVDNTDWSDMIQL